MGTNSKLYQLEEIETRGPTNFDDKIICTKNACFFFGGNSFIDQELYAYMAATNKWERLDSEGMPPSAAFITVAKFENMLLVYGGNGQYFGKNNNNKVYAFDLDLKREPVSFKIFDFPDDNKPVGHYVQAIAANEKYLYSFGGNYNQYSTNCIRRFDFVEKRWELLEPKRRNLFPSLHGYQVAIYKEELYLLGGGAINELTPLNLLKVFNLQEREWRTVETKGVLASDGSVVFPKPRMCFAQVKFMDDDGHMKIIFHGGCDLYVSRIYNDAWILNLDTLEWKRIPAMDSPFGIAFHSMDMAPEGRVYMFGGITGPSSFTNKLFRAWVKIPKLADMAFETLLNMESFRANHAELGLPHSYAKKFKLL